MLDQMDGLPACDSTEAMAVADPVQGGIQGLARTRRAHSGKRSLCVFANPVVCADPRGLFDRHLIFEQIELTFVDHLEAMQRDTDPTQANPSGPAARP